MSWRLLANNHREMGRGARSFDTARECWEDVDQLLSVHEDLKPRFSSLDERWQWRLLRPDGVAVATSGHGFDRRLRCERGLAAFTAILHTASSGRTKEAVPRPGPR
jgi:hypothetical protein